MDQTINAALKDSQRSLLETYKLSLTYDEDADECAKALLLMFEETMKIKDNGKYYELALEKAKMQMNLEDFDKEYENEMKGAKKTNFKKTSEYKAFHEELIRIKAAFANQNTNSGVNERMDNRVECGDLVMQTAISTTDPLTKRRMVNPVRNQKCSHYYEESSILEAITINPRLRCPVAGCGNNSYVEKKHLLRDEEFRLKLANMASQDDDDADNLN